MLCDGMGGLQGGQIASSVAVNSILSNLLAFESPEKSDEILRKVIKKANADVLQAAADSGIVGMGTTVTVLVINEKSAIVAHLGDSRIYQIRKGKGVIFQTKDHSLVNDLIDSGEITMDRAIDHPQRNVITKCIFVTGNRNDYQTPSITLIRDIQPHDIFMLCTDGVYSGFSNEKLSEILTSNESLEGKTKELADFCKNSCDNNTAYLVEVANVEERDDEEYNIQYTIDYGRQPICLHFLDFVREAASFIKETLCSKQHA